MLLVKVLFFKYGSKITFLFFAVFGLALETDFVHCIAMWSWISLRIPNEPVHEISNKVVCATGKASDQPAHTRSLIRAFASRLSIL